MFRPGREVIFEEPAPVAQKQSADRGAERRLSSRSLLRNWRRTIRPGSNHRSMKHREAAASRRGRGGAGEDEAGRRGGVNGGSAARPFRRRDGELGRAAAVSGCASATMCAAVI